MVAFGSLENSLLHLLHGSEFALFIPRFIRFANSELFESQ